MGHETTGGKTSGWKCVPPVDQVDAPALVQTGRAGTFVDVDLAVGPLEAVHTPAGVGSHVVQAGPAVLAGTLLTLIDLGLAVGPYTQVRWRRSRT